MARRAKWIGVILLLPCMLMIGVGNARGDIEQLSGTALSCNTLPPKCPDTYSNLLAQMMNLLSIIPPITVNIDQGIDVIDNAACHIYIDTDTSITLTLSQLLDADMRVIRDPNDAYIDFLRTWVDLDGISMDDLWVAIRGECGFCPGIFPFCVPINLSLALDELTIHSIALESITAMMLDTDAGYIELKHQGESGRPVGYSSVSMDMTMDMNVGPIGEFLQVDVFLDNVMNAIANQLIAPVIRDVLFSDYGDGATTGIMLEMIEDIINSLYDMPVIDLNCGGCGGMPSMPSFPLMASKKEFSAHVAANMMTYLLPFGAVLYYKRKRKK